MITSYKYEGKNEKELLNKALEELNANEKEVYYIVDKQDGGLFKTKKYTINIILKQQIIDYLKDFFTKMSALMKIKINFEIRIDNQYIKILLVSDNNSILIGTNGTTLKAIETIIKQALQELKIYDLKILIDASNYKEKKEKNFEREIDKICKEVLKTKLEAKLDPMNSYERRIVHTIVGKYENLISNSEGEEPKRYTIIKTKD